MCHKLKILYLIFIKNCITCKRHFISSLINAILPGILLAGILYIRSNLDVQPIHVNSTTYFPILTKNDLIDEVPRSMLHLYYKPQNTFTEKLILNATRCMTLPRSREFIFCFLLFILQIKKEKLHVKERISSKFYLP